MAQSFVTAPAIPVVPPLLAILASVVVAGWAAFALLYWLAVRKKALKSELIVVKIFITFWQSLPLLALGAIFTLLLVTLSMFQSGRRADATRGLGIGVGVTMGGIGIAWAIIRYIRLKQPPSEADHARTEAAAEASADPATGWPTKPAFATKGGMSNFIVTSALWGAGMIFMTVDGSAMLLTVLWPGALPPTLTARVLHGSGPDGPLAVGFLLLGIGIIGAAGGIALGPAVWRKLRKERPLSITPRGLYAFFWGKPWRFVPWEEVTSITRRRLPEDRLLNPRVEIEIAAANTVLLVTSGTRHYLRAWELLQRFAAEHRIRLRLVDHSKETMKRQRRVLDPAAYKAIAKTGVVSEISSLQGLNVDSDPPTQALGNQY
jgi:hypothetical protein